MPEADAELVGAGQAGRLLGVSRERVHQLIAAGRLAATRGPYGWRMVSRAEVLALVEERKRAQRARGRR
jgi:hypothetical protein